MAGEAALRPDRYRHKRSQHRSVGCSSFEDLNHLNPKEGVNVASNAIIKNPTNARMLILNGSLIRITSQMTKGDLSVITKQNAAELSTINTNQKYELRYNQRRYT